MYDVMKRCWAEKPTERPTFMAVLDMLRYAEVASENVYGSSLLSQPSNAVVTLPGRPEPPSTFLVLSATNQSLALSWQVPRANGVPVIGYQLTVAGKVDDWEEGRRSRTHTFILTTEGVMVEGLSSCSELVGSSTITSPAQVQRLTPLRRSLTCSLTLSHPCLTPSHRL